MRLDLLVLCAEMANYGLGTAHTHFRINAVQLHNGIRHAIGMEGAPDDPKNRRRYLNALSGLLDKVGASPQFVKIAEFKSAPEQYTRTQANRELASRPRDEIVKPVMDWIMIMAPGAFFVWRDPTAGQWLWLIVMGTLGAGAQFLIIRAYKAGEATFVAPFDYSKLLIAGLIGFFVFAEVPDLWTLAGAAVIVAATLYIARREARLGQAKPATESAG